jgi:hypothetical protein
MIFLLVTSTPSPIPPEVTGAPAGALGLDPWD